jgi:hypothetical protein
MLQAIAAVGAAGVAGCESDDPVTQTSTATGTATRSRTATSTGTETQTETRTESSTPESMPTDRPTLDPVATTTWTKESISGPVHRLTLANGTLYARVRDRIVEALDPRDGTQRWQYLAEGRYWASTWVGESTPGDTVYVTSTTRNQETLQGYLEAVDPDSGAFRWMLERREFMEPLGVVDGTLYVAGWYITEPPSELGTSESPKGEGLLHAVDADTGGVQWTEGVGDIRWPGVSLAEHGLYLYSSPEESDGSAGPETLRAFALDGTERWTLETGTHTFQPPLLWDGGIVSAVDGDTLAKLSPSGEFRWAVAGWDRVPVEIHSDGTNLYTTSESGTSLTADGEVRWRRDLSWGVIPPVTGERLYAGDGDAYLGVDPHSGETQWRSEFEDVSNEKHEGVVDDGLLVTWFDNPDLVLVDWEAGEPVGRVPLDERNLDVTTDGSALFAAGHDGVTAYEVSSPQ